MITHDGEPLVLSASSLSDYLTCSYRWYLRMVRQVPAVQSVAQALGSAVHAGVEAAWRGEDGHAALAESFVWSETTQDEPATVIDQGHRMLDVYRAKVIGTFTPTMIEQPFLIQINGVHFSGILDQAEAGVHDTKTTDGTFRPLNYTLQLTGYGVGYEYLAGHPPTELVLDVLTRKGGYRRYVVTPDRSDFVSTLAAVADSIEHERFVPDGAKTGACRWCSVASHCQYKRV